MNDDVALGQLAEAHGILASYRDMEGQEQTASPDTLRALLAANSVAAENARLARESLEAFHAQARARRFPEEVIIESRKATTLTIGSSDRWRLRLADSQDVLASGSSTDSIALPALASEVYALEVGAASSRETVRVIAAPARAPSVQDRAQLARTWGVTLALYGLQSSRNAGLGDYADLARLASSAGGLGAAFAATNPLHAMGHSSTVFSPYSPSHRGFLNTDHIALDAIPGLENAPVAHGLVAAAASEMARLRSTRHVDHHRHKSLHKRLLAKLYRAFRAGAAAWAHDALSRFVGERGRELERFARFEALACRNGPDWREWPHPLRDAHDDEAAEFHVWLQWIVDCQLGNAQRAAHESGMALGLCLDLAVGARRGGAESWCDKDVIAHGVSMGAPPDHLNPHGQNWNVSAFAPHRLAAKNYRPLRRLLASSMRHAGALRIDHVLGLNRGFWIPDDGSPGGYVRQNFAALVAILKIEAERHGTIVIGEDLGLVPSGFRETMRAHGIHGYSVMQYERGQDRRLKPARLAPEQALACFSTHDTPTVRGFEIGRDIDWWERLGWIDTQEAVRARQQRRKDLADIAGHCTTRGNGGFNSIVHGSLARSPSALVSVQLDDIFEHEEAQNLPGTVDEHVNWRRKYGVDIERLAEDGRLRSLATVMNENRTKSDRNSTEG